MIVFGICIINQFLLVKLDNISPHIVLKVLLWVDYHLAAEALASSDDPMSVVQVALVVVAQYAVLDSSQIKVYLIIYHVLLVVRAKHQMIVTHVSFLDGMVHDIVVVINPSPKCSQVGHHISRTTVPVLFSYFPENGVWRLG